VDLAVDAIGAGPSGLLGERDPWTWDMAAGLRAPPARIAEVTSFWTLWNLKSQVKVSCKWPVMVN